MWDEQYLTLLESECRDLAKYYGNNKICLFDVVTDKSW